MLVLTRKLNQSIIIDENIKIRIIDISEGGVKIGIDAPKNIPIFREEIFEEIQKENQRAAAAPKDFSLDKII